MPKRIVEDYLMMLHCTHKKAKKKKLTNIKPNCQLLFESPFSLQKGNLTRRVIL